MSANRKTVTELLLSNWGLSLLTLTLLLPVMADVERFLFPVVSKLEIVSTEPFEGGLALWVSFEKYRSCEFVDLTFKQDGDRRRVRFPPADEDLPISRPEGAWVTGPWVVDITELGGLEVTVEHRCHPLWNLFTHLYP